MKSQTSFDRVLSVVVTLCAVVVAGAVVYRTFRNPVPRAEAVQGEPVFVKGWEAAIDAGTRIGSSDAPITIVDVADLECPVCRGFYSTIEQTLATFPTQVAVVHVSHPLNYHKFALPAARGAECAAEQGRFAEWIDAIYKKQDSLGLKSWGSYAHDAQVADSAELLRCATTRREFPKITKGLAYGETVRLTGTPTILVNGWRLPGPPTPDRLRSIIDLLLKGEDPFAPDRWSKVQ